MYFIWLLGVEGEQYKMQSMYSYASWQLLVQNVNLIIDICDVKCWLFGQQKCTKQFIIPSVFVKFVTDFKWWHIYITNKLENAPVEVEVQKTPSALTLLYGVMR